jgi:transcriptional regulator with GAF, ATPase, and Fis domain
MNVIAIADIKNHGTKQSNHHERLLHDLGERVKELIALHGTACLLQEHTLSIEEVFGRVARLIPPAFQYPDVTQAKLTFGEIESATSGFRPTPWCLQTSLKTKHGTVLTIDVVYLAERTKSAHGPFLSEEVSLMHSLGEMLVAFLERRAAESELRQLKDQLFNENIALKEEIDRTSMLDDIIGGSPRLMATLRLVSQVAPTDSTVLITGETGTGKELVARAIHKKSLRCDRPFVSVNCSAIPHDLIGSELFGHERGAFTGALQRRIGRFELAEAGTIFLDEVGELPAETQVALLRVLQERTFERVGGNQSIRANVRVLAATNRDLPAAIAAGTFRNDLFYRLNVFPVEIAPLRERKDDIPLLVHYFVDRFARKIGKSIKNVDEKTLASLLSYSWPGNIRELQNVIERSVIVSERDILVVDERWLSRAPSAIRQSDGGTLLRKSDDEVIQMIETALAETRGRIGGPSGAAAMLGIPASTLESKIKAFRIDKGCFRNAWEQAKH